MTGIFRAYDIRGIYGKDLNEEIAKRIGAAFGTINKGTIAVGMDARLSGPSLKTKLMEGLRSTGCNVVDVGMITTPMMIFAVGNYKLDGGVMVTASHNPKDYNGFKLFTKGAMPLSYESGGQKVEEPVKSGNFTKGTGGVKNMDVVGDYSNFILGYVNVNGKGMKIIVDAGNGSAGRIHCDVLRKAGFEVTELFCEPDGNFPNHVPDPTEPKNIEMLKQRVKETGADMGIAFDGDGDRLGVIDRHGNEVIPNDIFIMLAKHALRMHGGGNVVVDLACSMTVSDSIGKAGGVTHSCKVGHTYIAQMMAEQKAVFGGELSGHYFFRETFSGDDALFASLKLLEFLHLNNTSFEKESAAIPRYFSQIGEHQAIPYDSAKGNPIEKIKRMYREKGCKVDDRDGAKIMYKDGWMLFRPSNTSPLIRYGFEARSRETFEEMRKMVEEIKGMIPA
ncbi:MAG: phosphomannomutase/phosphoglucomutase [Candidatus Aenigmatarchaeota archaeon]